LRTHEEISKEIIETGNWAFIYFVPKEELSKELCMIAIRKSKYAIGVVPEKYEDVYKMWKIMYG